MEKFYNIEVWTFHKPERHQVYKNLRKHQFEIGDNGFIKIKVPQEGLYEEGCLAKKYYIWEDGFGPKME